MKQTLALWTTFIIFLTGNVWAVDPPEKKPSCAREMVNLRNGTEEFGPLVRITLSTLNTLLADDPITFFDLREKCLYPQHDSLSEAQKRTLQSMGLLDMNGQPDASICNILLNATEGERPWLRLIPPYAPSPPPSPLDSSKG